MFYRRKIILGLLQLFDDRLEKIRLQKLLFLFSQKQGKPDYDFVPYRYGCYSFSANADLTTMVKKGYLTEDDASFRKVDQNDYLKELKPIDYHSLLGLKVSFGRMSSNDLTKHTYQNFPFYAIHSEVASELLDTNDVTKIAQQKPKISKTILYTIGYEGVSLENYLLKLIKNDVKLLVDVRKNPLSMKYGFSKNQLKKFCENLGIQYTHIPEVGIQSDQRQCLHTQQDYDQLFEIYNKVSIPNTRNEQRLIIELLKQHQRIALTCYEANICQCHRKHLADAIASNPQFKYELKHL